MEMWQKYLEKKDRIENALKVYLELRRLFQSYDWSESDLESPPFYSSEMMSLRNSFGSKIGKLYNDINDLGLDVSRTEFNNYLNSFLTKINELTPLKYGNNERGNQGDEDY
jgi:hypothetical protein